MNHVTDAQTMINADPLIRAMTDHLPSSTDPVWRKKAGSMLTALICVVRYKCLQEKCEATEEIVKGYLPLTQMSELCADGKCEGWSEETRQKLEGYLSTLAGFRIGQIGRPSEWRSQVLDQHGYLAEMFLTD